MPDENTIPDETDETETETKEEQQPYGTGTKKPP